MTRRLRHYFRIAVPAIIWVATMLVFFGCYELVERIWFAGADSRLLHTRHILRCITASVLAALLVGFYVARRAPSKSLLGGILSADPVSDADAVRRRSAWFIQMRWLAIVLAGVAVFVGSRLTDLMPPENALPLSCCLLCLVGANVFFSLTVSGTVRPYRFLIAQVVGDLVILTLLLHFSGGIENPCYKVYLFHVVIAGIVLARRDAIRITVLASCLFLGLVCLEFLRLVPHSYIGLFPHGVSHNEHAVFDPVFVAGRTTTFLLIMGFIGYFTILLRDQIRHDEAGLIQAGKMAVLGDLAGRIAHEINNPIGIVIARVKLLMEDKGLPPSMRATLSTIDKQGQRIADLTRGLLTFSRPSPGGRSPLDLNRVVAETLAFVEPQIKRAAIRLEKNLASKLPAVRGNFNEIQQILLNLIKNAADAMPTGGRLSIDTCGAEDRLVAIRISDTGVGIPRRILPRIFDPFFSTKEEVKGTGLGLAIVHGLIRSHEGSIAVESSEGDGTVFTIRFPSLPGGSP